MVDLAKVRFRILTLMVFAVMCLTVTAGVGIYKLNAMSERMIAAQEDSRRHVLLLQAIESAHVHFKSQVQEWKDILLRGTDAQALQHHRILLDHESSRVSQMLMVTVDALGAIGLDPKEAVALQVAQDELLKNYRATLDQYDPGIVGNAKKIDAIVKGMDRKTSEMFEQVTEGIEVHARQRLDELVKTTKLDANFTLWTVLGVATAGIGLAIMLSLWILRDLLKLFRS
jgi:methyl-accepting chemotaxis protein-1 (serine sensor receptor)